MDCWKDPELDWLMVANLEKLMVALKAVVMVVMKASQMGNSLAVTREKSKVD
jgi:hypothetical protein